MSNSVDPEEQSISVLLTRIADGSSDAKQRLYERIYDDLRDAARRVKRSSPRTDLQTTGLVNEVLLRFEASDAIASFRNRRVLFAVAIRAMRHVLIDHYRRRKKSVDSPDRVAVPLDQVVLAIENQVGYDFELLQLAMDWLQATFPRQHAVLDYRIFGGFTIAETAQLLEVSRQSVERDWKLARAKLFRFMMHESESRD